MTKIVFDQSVIDFEGKKALLGKLRIDTMTAWNAQCNAMTAAIAALFNQLPPKGWRNSIGGIYDQMKALDQVFDDIADTEKGP